MQAHGKACLGGLVGQRERLRQIECIGGCDGEGAAITGVFGERIAQVEIGAFADGGAQAEVNSVEVADVEGLGAFDEARSGEVGDTSEGVEVQLGVTGIEGEPTGWSPAGVISVLAGACAVGEQVGCVGVVEGAGECRELQRFQLVLDAAVEGVVVFLRDGEEWAVGTAEFGVELDGELS